MMPTTPIYCTLIIEHYIPLSFVGVQYMMVMSLLHMMLMLDVVVEMMMMMIESRLCKHSEIQRCATLPQLTLFHYI